MSSADAVAALIDALEASQIEYVLVGALAYNVYGSLAPPKMPTLWWHSGKVD